MDTEQDHAGKMGKVIRHVLLRGVLMVSAFLGTAATGGALEKQVEEWIHRLKTDPIEARKKLIGEIRREAAPRSGHPPKVSSNRIDLFPVLEAALGNDDRHVRTEAICALSYMKCPAAFPILEQAMQSDYGEVRYYACMGIGWLADEGDLRERAVAALERVRDRAGEAFNIRLHATSGLAELGLKQEPEIFVEALRDPRANDSLAATQLARMGRKDTIELMIVRLRTAVPSGDHWLAEALKELTGESLGKDAKAWQQWLDAHRAELPPQLKYGEGNGSRKAG